MRVRIPTIRSFTSKLPLLLLCVFSVAVQLTHNNEVWLTGTSANSHYFMSSFHLDWVAFGAEKR